ncbi:U3 small nucleolar RNA-associated protein 13, putative [Plasmodium chabaudi chabaudi]|uniref:U3 small nucleolar RNA-associated protein 13, putative n=1 Tax=Plasmodium chabaudi chabaudi TaxID=31271 RepID=A0A1C6YM72_PLACU|nr:U3 small nucleolar RNA-associated protein 13, putative [Plasmodium chabaudi chabaudi]
MSIISSMEIDRKHSDFYDGDNNVYYSKEYELFLSLCNNNIYCFKVNDQKNAKSQSLYNVMYPTLVLESCIDIDDIKEDHNKKYSNKNCISLFNSIGHFYYSDKNVFLSTDDNNIHHYILVPNNLKEENNENENDEKDVNDESTEKNIYLYDYENGEDEKVYSYSYNWIYLKQKKIWKTNNINISCFSYNNIKYKKLIVGYINGLINVYNLNTYKLAFSYKIHNSRITNLRMYKHFIISSDITKNIFIYDIDKKEKVISCEDHMSGIVDFLFLAIKSGNDQIKIEAQNMDEENVDKEYEEEENEDEEENDEGEGDEEKDEDEDEEENDEGEEETLIGFISIGNDKIMNVWNLSALNLENEEEFDQLKNEQNNINASSNKKRKNKKNSNMITQSPIKQIYLANDINNAIIVPSNIFKNNKSKLSIEDDNIKWLILTHNNSGDLIFYNPLKGNIIYKFKENKYLINESNVIKLVLLKHKLYIFREDSSILIYDIRTFRLIKIYACKLEGIFEMIFFNPNPKPIINDEYSKSSDEDEDSINLKYDAETFESDSIMKNKCAILIGDNIIRILNFEDNLISQKLLIGHEDVVSCIKISERNLLLFSGSNDKNIFVWNLKNNNCLYILKDNLYTINAIDVNLKKFPKILLVSVCEDSSLKLWNFSFNLDNLKDNKKKRKIDQIYDNEVVKSNFTIYPHKAMINDVTISRNSKMIATCSKDKTIKLFEANTLKLISSLEGHTKSVQNICFSRTSNLLYSSTYESIRIWDMSTYQCLKNIQSLDFNITKMLILNDNCMINGYSNGNISIINIKNSEKLSTVNYHDDKIFCLQSYNNNNEIVSSSINGDLIFFKNVSEKKVSENIYEKKKNIYYENCLENLLKENKINESLLICLKLNKKFKFKTIIENYLNSYTFNILNILKQFEYEYGIRRIMDRTNNNSNSIPIKKETNYYKDEEMPNKLLNANSQKSNLSIDNSNIDSINTNMEENKLKNLYYDDSKITNIQNHLENADILEKYIYTKLSELESEKLVNNGNNITKENTSMFKDHDQKKINELHFSKQVKEEDENNDENFVMFLKKMKATSEHSYFLYLNKLMDFISFFVMNHRFAYIANFLLNSLIKYISYSDICKINNYQRFFDIYNSYIPRHRNRYLKDLQKSKCFELININYYKGDIKMMN